MPARRRSSAKTRKTAIKVAVADAMAEVDPAFGLVGFRPAQWEFFDLEERTGWLLARRQFGKTYLFGGIGLNWMAEEPGTEVLMVSASMRLGTETIRKEAQVWKNITSKLKVVADSIGHKLSTSAEDDAGALLDVDAIADMFEHGKLESRLWWDNSTYSRTITVAPNPDTAVGYTSYMLWDEVGRMPEFQDLSEALTPIMASNPKLKMRGATTPPPDDAHYSWELLAPPPGEEFPVKERGNWYRNKEGHRILRVTAYDAYAGGVPLYDQVSGHPITPAEDRAKARDKQAWDRNYGCEFIRGGTSALSLMSLYHAAAAGRGLCLGVNCTDTLAA